MLNNKMGPPGLGIIGLLDLCLSYTNFPFIVRNFIKAGIKIIVIKKEIIDAIIVPIMNSSWLDGSNLNYYKLSIYNIT